MPDVKTILTTMLCDCRTYWNSYYYIGIKVGAVWVSLYCILLLFQAICCRKFSKDSILRFFIKIPFVALLGFYCYLIFGITILSREPAMVRILRLIPFSTWGMEQGYLILWIENILMTVPLGVLLYILWVPCRKISWSLFVGCCFSLTIECVQFFTRLGKFETDDIMTNVLGILLAFLLCKGIHRLFLHIRER